MKIKNLLTDASPYIFLAASAMTADTAPNERVSTGGVLLSLAAGFAVAASNGLKKAGNAVPFFCLLANIPLTFNGAAMARDSFANGQTGPALAGGLLATANGVFYSTANLQALGVGISPRVHAFRSACAGGLIAVAGAAVKDPVLSGIGIAFLTEAALRYDPAPAVA